MGERGLPQEYAGTCVGPHCPSIAAWLTFMHVQLRSAVCSIHRPHFDQRGWEPMDKDSSCPLWGGQFIHTLYKVPVGGAPVAHSDDQLKNVS